MRMRSPKTTFVLFLLFCLFWPCAPGCGASIEAAPALPRPEAPSEAEARSVGEAINRLGLDLFGRLATEEGDLVFSPASIEAALAMTAAGARGETAAQMREALHLGEDHAALIGALGDSLRRWDDPGREAYRLRVASRLFGDRGAPFEAAYLELTRRRFAAPLSLMDFRGAPDPSRRAINGWIEERTAGHIRELLPEPAVTRETRLILVNALYLFARWEEPFDPRLTRPAPFTLAGGEAVEAPTMRRRGYFAYAEREGAKIVEIPYRGGELVMRLLLPPVTQTVPQLSTQPAVSILLSPPPLQPMELELFLPRFRVAPPAIPLSVTLRALGMERAFVRGEADLRGISDPPSVSERLYLSEVLHQAFLAVDEEGTEAAAATAVVAGGGGAGPAPELRFDRPFLFALCDRATGAALFLGRLSDPR